MRARGCDYDAADLSPVDLLPVAGVRLVPMRGPLPPLAARAATTANDRCVRRRNGRTARRCRAIRRWCRRARSCSSRRGGRSADGSTANRPCVSPAGAGRKPPVGAEPAKKAGLRVCPLTSNRLLLLTAFLAGVGHPGLTGRDLDAVRRAAL